MTRHLLPGHMLLTQHLELCKGRIFSIFLMDRSGPCPGGALAGLAPPGCCGGAEGDGAEGDGAEGDGAEGDGELPEASLFGGGGADEGWPVK